MVLELRQQVDSIKQQQTPMVEDFALIKVFIMKLNQLWNLGAVSPYSPGGNNSQPVFKKTEIRYKEFINAIPKVMLVIVYCFEIVCDVM